MSNTTVYSLDDISKHNTKNDLYMAIHNKVYNITDFVLEVNKKIFLSFRNSLANCYFITNSTLEVKY